MVRVEHSLVVTLPGFLLFSLSVLLLPPLLFFFFFFLTDDLFYILGSDIQCTLPVALWDEVANYLRDEAVVRYSSTSPLPYISYVMFQQEEGTIDWETEWLPVWVDDEAVDKCTLCRQPFHVFNRKV